MTSHDINTVCGEGRVYLYKPNVATKMFLLQKVLGVMSSDHECMLWIVIFA